MSGSAPSVSAPSFIASLMRVLGTCSIGLLLLGIAIGVCVETSNAVWARAAVAVVSLGAALWLATRGLREGVYVRPGRLVIRPGFGRRRVIEATEIESVTVAASSRGKVPMVCPLVLYAPARRATAPERSPFGNWDGDLVTECSWFVTRRGRERATTAAKSLANALGVEFTDPPASR